MTVYIKVTNDQYRLIEYIADSVEELAKLCGSTPNRIYSAISHAQKKGYNCIYEKVEI